MVLKTSHSQFQFFIRHRTFRRARDVRGVFRQHAARVAGRGFLPRLAAGVQFFAGDFERQFAFLGVNGDGVAVLHERERPAGVCFRRDVPDDEAVAAAGKPSVGDERHVLAESLAHDGRRGRKHLAQAREQMSLDEERRFWMASRCHAERVSIYSAKKSLRHPFRVE